MDIAKIVALFLPLQLFALSLLAIQLPNIFHIQSLQDYFYQFTYRLQNGSLFRGNSFPLARGIRILIDENKNVHWTGLLDTELHSTDSLHEAVKPVNRTMDGFTFKSDYDEYYLHVESNSNSQLEIRPYATEWDFSNVCFHRIDQDNRAFRFCLKSINNNLKYNGTTEQDMTNHLKHTFDVKDGQLTGKYQAEFTQTELNLLGSICKNVTEISAKVVVLDTRFDDNIDPKLVKSLVG